MSNICQYNTPYHHKPVRFILVQKLPLTSKQSTKPADVKKKTHDAYCLFPKLQLHAFSM